jgi:hypothetical protein
VGAENLSTSRDQDIFVDEPAESIQPHDPYIGPWNQLADNPQGWLLTQRAMWPMLVGAT